VYVVEVMVDSVVMMVVVVATSSVRYGGVVVVVVDVVTAGLKHEQASERTELEKPLKSNNRYFKSIHRTYKTGLEPCVLVELREISSSR
jgi:hypothetical protein